LLKYRPNPVASPVGHAWINAAMNASTVATATGVFSVAILTPYSMRSNRQRHE
jgi:hypothetical protein